VLYLRLTQLRRRRVETKVPWPAATGPAGRPGHVRWTVCVGGTKVNTEQYAEAVAVVDLQALHLDAMSMQDGGLLIGATVTLERLAQADDVPAVIAEASRREAPSTLRAMATVGGCIATANPASELLASFLVHDAKVRLAGPDGQRDLELAGLLTDRSELAGRIIVAVHVETDGIASVARVGRTRADLPIVAAVARRTVGRGRRLALTGVAATPVLVTVESAADHLDPPADFRGSTDYRRALARVLSRRALEEVG
jgi:CO/xanthine dehydrogenase FAD-binding subunit